MWLVRLAPLFKLLPSTLACSWQAACLLDLPWGKLNENPSAEKDQRLIGYRGLVATVPIYLSEISDPNSRGLIGGISGCGISFGTMMSNWVGFACSYGSYGPLQWRLPLAIQIPWSIIMFIGLSTFMPSSPRQLIRSGEIERARSGFAFLRRGVPPHEVEEEFMIMQAQIEYEAEREIGSYREIFKTFRHRVFV